jgi:hypothetical protein
MSEVICAVPCLCNEAWGISTMFCAVPCLCNEVWSMSGVIYFIVPYLCNEVWCMSWMIYVINIVDIPQASLHKHGTAQITSDIP